MTSAVPWRETLGDLWTSIATRETSCPQAPDTLCRGVDEAASALGALLVGPARRGDAQRTITIGALVLELAAATAALWPDEEASGRVDLLRMLESRLAGQEEAALCGDPGYRPLPQRVQCLAESVSQRIQGPLARDPCRTAQPVQRSLVEMASLAVRASVNLQRFGDASGPTASPPCGWYAHLVWHGSCVTPSADRMAVAVLGAPGWGQ